MMDSSVNLSRFIKAHPQALFRAFTTPGGLMDWCANAVALDTAKGNYFFLWSENGYQLTGTIEETFGKEELTWRNLSPENGAIKVRVRTHDEETSQVILQLTGEYRGESHILFWNESLTNLKAVLETGFDSRVYDRPMLGILIGGLLDAQAQEKYASPVSYGIIVSGTVAGMGAEKLGMAENDILSEMDGVEIHDYRDLENVVSSYKAGDTIQVSWYRKGIKQSGTLSFSGRPAPYIPPSPVELADYIESIYKRSGDELAEILAGATEEQAEFRTAENEWNVKEILAHAIVTERAAHLWIAAAHKGEVMKTWSSSDHALIQSVISSSPTLAELVFELHRAEKQSIHLIRWLPPELVTYKAAYTNIVTTLGEQGLPLHTRMHFENIKALLSSAQN